MTPDRDLYAGLIRLHILHHAAQGPVFGLWVIEELSHHGYKMSAGTLYPILYGLERKGYLASRTVGTGRTRKRLYRATGAGKKALVAAREKVRELFGELLEIPEARPEHPRKRKAMAHTGVPRSRRALRS